MAQTNANGGNRRKDYRIPAYDITEDADSFRVYLDMPGVKQDKLDVEYHDREITVTGDLDNSNFENYKLGWQEFRPYGFRRQFAVPEHINVEGISAQLKNGVVTLTLPKSEAVKPRRIAITAG